MKLFSTVSLLLALSASPLLADTPPAKAPAEKKAPPADKKAPSADKPADSKKPMVTPEELKRAEAFFDDLHGAVVKNQDACPKMATAVNGVLDKHAEFIRKMVASDKDVPQATKDKWEKKQGDMAAGIMKCKDDKAVMAAFQRFSTLSSPPPAKK